MSARKPLRYIAVVGAVLAATVALIGCHRWAHRTPEDRAARINEAVNDKLDLSDAQAAKFRQVTDEGLVIAHEFRKQRQDDLSFLIQEVTAGELDKDRLLALYQKRRDVLDQRVPAVVDKLVEFHKSLNDEQKTELADKLKKIEEYLHQD